MKIYVCVKQVPDTAADIAVTGENVVDDAVKWVMNPYDAYAVEEAVRTAERHGGEVVAVTVGRESAEGVIRDALAVGCHRGILVILDTALPDSATTALALKTAIEQDVTPDLIFAGRQSVDTEGMQTHYRLAAAMQMPVANPVVSFALENGRAIAACELDGGDREIVEMDLPCVIGAARGLNDPRYPKLPDIIKANKKPLKKIDISEMELLPPANGVQRIAIASTPNRGRARMLEGNVREMVEALVVRLKTEAKVL